MAEAVEDGPPGGVDHARDHCAMHDKGTGCVRIDIPITAIRQTATGVVVLRVQI